MLKQYEFYTIIQEEKYINEDIKIGGFIKNSFQLFFINEELNSINAYLDISKSGSIEIKHNINNRVKTSIPILRLDINGHHHSNPLFDEKLINELNIEIDNNIKELMKKYSGHKYTKDSHLHYYIEHFRDRWAFPPEEFNLEITDDFQENIKIFCHNFNIKANLIKEGLF